jgi:hypothetical protein
MSLYDQIALSQATLSTIPVAFLLISGGDILITKLWQFFRFANISQLFEASQFCRYVGIGIF